MADRSPGLALALLPLPGIVPPSVQSSARKEGSCARWRRRETQAILLGLLLLIGCSGQPPALTQVRGKVWYKGVPLKGGTIVFTPDAGAATAATLPSRKSRPMAVFSSKPATPTGAAPGWHRITIAALSPGTTSPQGHPYTPLPQSLLPDKYRDPELSGLHCQVKANQPNTIDFQLE